MIEDIEHEKLLRYNEYIKVLIFLVVALLMHLFTYFLGWKHGLQANQQNVQAVRKQDADR